MSALAELPFAEQVERIQSADDAELFALLAEAAELADSEPLGQVIERLATSLTNAESKDISKAATLTHEELFETLLSQSDPALQHLLTRGAQTADVVLLYRRFLNWALRRLPISRISTLSLLTRMLRRRHPEDHQTLLAEASAAVMRFENGKPNPHDVNYLFFASGKQLIALQQVPADHDVVASTTREAILALAQGPKSLSQANAESLLSKRVYADPGHFFFELMQNASDAGATFWEVDVDANGVTLTHDGEPFSFSDLVGVVSIGQTTKRSDQIGFFGVGFKSVYEITDRPRIHSGVFDFEIAHVSIPRKLVRSSLANVPRADQLTELYLPFRSTVTDYQKIADHALAIPPETLMTLNNLEAITVRVGGEVKAQWRESKEGDVRHLTSSMAPTRSYRFVEGLFTFAGQREEGRTHQTQVLVAARLGTDHTPQAIEEGPTLYAYLPTREHSGLKFLVHARFDVTLDRERLEAETHWNEGLLGFAGALAAKLVTNVVSLGHSPLVFLPTIREVAPTVAPLVQSLRSLLQKTPWLRNTEGQLIPPAQAALLEHRLLESFAGIDLSSGEPAQQPTLSALARLSPREEMVAEFFSVRRWSASELWILCTTSLVAGHPAPKWLTAAVLTALAESLEQPMVEPSTTLQSLPFLRTSADTLVTPKDALVGSSTAADLYMGVRPVVSRGHINALPPALQKAASFSPLTFGTLHADLSGPNALKLTHREGLFEVLYELNTMGAEAILDLAIFPTVAGRNAALRDHLHHLDRALRDIAALIPSTLPLLDQTFAEEHWGLISDWVPTITLANLPLFLANMEHTRLEVRDYQTLTNLLNAKVDELNQGTLHAFARLPIFLDNKKHPRPLLAEIDPVSALAAHPDLRHILPSHSWLAEPDGAFVKAVGPKRVGATELVQALSSLHSDIHRASRPSLLPSIATDEVPQVMRWLGGHARTLAKNDLDLLVRLPVFQDSEGRLTKLARLRRERKPSQGSTETLIETFYNETELRKVASRATEVLVAALDQDQRLLHSDFELVCGDLVALESDITDLKPLISSILNAAAATARREPHASSKLRASLLLIATKPWFQDGDGNLASLASWHDDAHAKQSRGVFRGGALRALLTASTTPLLADSEEALLSPFLELIGFSAPTILNVLHAGSFNEDFVKDHAAAIKSQLRNVSEELYPQLEPVLRSLPIFTSKSGALACAHQLVSRDAFLFFEDQDLTDLHLDEHLISDADGADCRRFGLALGSKRALLERAVLGGLREGHALSEQPVAIRSVNRLALLAAEADEAGFAVPKYPLALDTNQVIRTGTVYGASPSEHALLTNLSSFVGPRLTVANREWQTKIQSLESNAGQALVKPLPMLIVSAALRTACPSELPRSEHPGLTDLDLVYDWLRDAGEVLSQDKAALAELGNAHFLLCQRGTLTAPRSLVLDQTVPDIGLGWGIASEVPEDIAQWCAQVFEIDRQQRRVMIEYVLDAIASITDSTLASTARTVGTPQNHRRLWQLIQFLASAAGAGVSSSAELEQRVSYTKIKSRLKVPLINGGFEKPKRALLLSSDPKIVSLFPKGLPVVDTSRAEARGEYSGRLPQHTAALLIACGAETNLTKEQLTGALKSASGESRAQLSLFIAQELVRSPRLREVWQLGDVAWCCDRRGDLRREVELLWPSDLGAVFKSDANLLPCDAVASVSADARRLLQIKSTEDLSWTEFERRFTEHGKEAIEGSPALLTWLEKRLSSGEASSKSVADLFAARLWLPDHGGTLRLAKDLCLSGASELFGEYRGDLPDFAFSHLGRALGIADSPDERLVRRFIADIADEAPIAVQESEPSLVATLSNCFERLGEHYAHQARDGGRFEVRPLVGSIAAIGLTKNTSSRIITNIDDSRLILPEPDHLFEHLAQTEDEALSLFFEPLPVAERTSALSDVLLASGIPDLLSFCVVLDVDLGALEPDPLGLTAGLHLMLRDFEVDGVRCPAVSRVELRASIKAKFVLVLGGDTEGESYRKADKSTATDFIECDAVFYGGVLSITPEALPATDSIADALVKSPTVRAALRTRLRQGAWRSGQSQSDGTPSITATRTSATREVVTKHPLTTSETNTSQSPTLWDRVRRLWSGTDSESADHAEGKRSADKRSADKRSADKRSADKRSADKRSGDKRSADRSSGDDKRELKKAPPSNKDVERRRPPEGRTEHAVKREPAPRNVAPPQKELTDDGLFRPKDELGSQLSGARSWRTRQTVPPDFGFAFAPKHVPAPWTYAPNFFGVRFDSASQTFLPSAKFNLVRKDSDGVGVMAFRGLLPKGRSVLPIPFGAVLTSITSNGAPIRTTQHGGLTSVDLREVGDIRLRVKLVAPTLSNETSAASPGSQSHRSMAMSLDGDALKPFVPDAELPTEVHEFVESIDLSTSLFSRATQVRDFVRSRYRYDPSYLENDAVAEWLKRQSQHFHHVHIAALHGGRDGKHLGAGVCYELNTLACELSRRVGVPAVIATGWVLSGGALSEPDHLWFMINPGGDEWLPLDASTTLDGRPLRVPKRLAGNFRSPKDRDAIAPSAPKWANAPGSGSRRSDRQHVGDQRPNGGGPQHVRTPTAELLKVIYFLETKTGQSLSKEERAELTYALNNPENALRLLERLRKRMP